MPFGRGRKVDQVKRNTGAAAAIGGLAAVSGLPPTAHPIAGEDGTVSVVRGSRIELVRMIAADLVEKIRTAEDSERLALFMQLRKVQDCIAGLKHANAIVGAKTSRLAWVDVWTPADI